MIGDNLQVYTYQYLMELALSLIPNDRDKRQGSVIYDALAPFCQLLASGYMEQQNFYHETYAVTATGENLDNRVGERGISRYLASNAIKRITLEDSNGEPVSAAIGARFSTVSETNPVIYEITNPYRFEDQIVPGSYEATCEQTGTIGNEYSGNIISISFIPGLASAYMTTTLVPARDEESDDDLRERYFASLNQEAFGGNVADYRQKVTAITGVGAVQVYPTWNGGGSVKLSIVDPSYGPCSTEFISRVQEEVDPENMDGVQGQGLGIAPIGHEVTVVTPTEVTFNIEATVLLRQGFELGQVEQPILESLQNYFAELRKAWATPYDFNTYTCDIYVARATAAIVTVLGVANVTNVLVNGEELDVYLEQSGTNQYLPKLGEVVIHVQ